MGKNSIFKMLIFTIITLILFGVVNVNTVDAACSNCIGSYFGGSNDPQVRRIEGTAYFGDYGTGIYTYFKKISHENGVSLESLGKSKRVAYCAQSKLGHASATDDVIYWTDCEDVKENNKEIAYIMINGFKTAEGADFDVGYLTTQVAIWYYTDEDSKSVLDNFPTTAEGITNNSFKSNVQKVLDLKNKAKSYNPSLSISIDNNDNKMELIGNYYVSKAITLNGSDLNSKISITISNASGAFATSNINATSGTNTFSAGDKIYIKIPASNVSSLTSLNVKATASALYYEGTVKICHRSDSQDIFDLPNPQTTTKDLSADLALTVEPLKINVKISKEDITESKEVEGATLVVKKANTTVEKWVSGKTAKTISLDPGTYTLEETIAPAGYKLNTGKVTFIVNNNGTVTVGGNVVDEVVIKNEPFYIIISKLGIDKGKELIGAKLKITDKEGKLTTDLDGKSLEWITTENVEKFHLADGTYYLTEVEAPAGYIKNDKTIEFVVEKDGTIKVSNKVVTKVILENTPFYVYISKKSINGKTELPGAKLKITDKEGKLEKDLDGKSLIWTSSTKEERFHLAPGNYVLTELEAPKGYELSDTVIEFTVTEDGRILFDKKETENNMIVFKNTPEPEQVVTGSALIYILFVGIITAGVVTFFVLKRND